MLLNNQESINILLPLKIIQISFYQIYTLYKHKERPGFSSAPQQSYTLTDAENKLLRTQCCVAVNIHNWKHKWQILFQKPQQLEVYTVSFLNLNFAAFICMYIYVHTHKQANSAVSHLTNITNRQKGVRVCIIMFIIGTFSHFHLSLSF